MILYFENADKFAAGIKELSGDLAFKLGNREEADICVAVKETEDEIVEVSLNKNEATITYGNQPIRFFRGLGILCEAIADGKDVFKKTQKPNFKTNGSLLDVSYSMVLRPEVVKEILCKQAIMGLNTLALYLEDMFEVPQYPYFGYQRGRYTKDEIRDMDKYAQMFGIELFPCVQTLGHAEQILKWSTMGACREDYNPVNTLLVGSEETYDLIDKMFASLSDSFTSRRIDVGMDGAPTFGCVVYKKKNGLRPQFDIFCEHLVRVKEIADKYGFEITISSDILFEIFTGKRYTSEIEFTKEQIKRIPEGIRLNYWQHTILASENEVKVFDAQENEKVLKIHKKITDNILYSGGIQTWVGPVPAYLLSVYSAKEGLFACIRNGVSDVLAALWNDGGEGALVLGLYGILLYAEMDYNGEYDEAQLKKRFKYIFGFDADDILDLEEINYPAGRKNSVVPIEEDYVKTAFALLYNDPLLGMADKYIAGIDACAFYKALYEKFKNRGPESGLFAPAFKYIKSIIYILSVKADYGLRLKKAYDLRDAAMLDKLYEESKKIEMLYEKFKNEAREFYLYYNKAFGSEVTELHNAAMASRFETVRYHLNKLKEDPTYVIEELEEERMLLVPEGQKTDPQYGITNYQFSRFFSASGLTKLLVIG